MILSKTPFRISFFGGGTDLVPWYKEHGGAVISTTINKFCHISIRHLPPFFEYKHRIVYSNIELVKTIDEINHPSVRETLRYFNVREGLEIHHDGDLPARSGLGSSSSFTVGLVRALKALEGKMIDAKALSETALHIEQELIKEACGSQDQVAAAYGGFNKITFNKDSIRVSPVLISRNNLDMLENGLCLFFTGVSRLANDIEKDKLNHLDKKKKSLLFTRQLVEEAQNILTSSSFNLTSFGFLLNEAWEAKKKLSKKVTTELVDSVYEKAIKMGAYGGKILGAGGGGFILFCIEPWMKDRLIASMYPLIHVPFKFEPEGARIALYHPNGI